MSRAWWAAAGMTLAERIHVRTLTDDNGCHLWQGSTNTAGYAVMTLSVPGRSGVRVYVHRATYELAHGQIPRGLQLDHTCRVRHCVNPGHLEPVTKAENLSRRVYL